MSDYEFNYKVWLIVSQVLTVIGGICFVVLVAARFSLTINELVAAYFQGQTAFMKAGRAARKAKLDEVLPKAEPQGRAKMLNESLKSKKAMVAKVMADERQSQLDQLFAKPPKGWSISK